MGLCELKQLLQEMSGIGHRYLDPVRPVTSIAVAVLLGMILIAFVFKLAAGGLTP